MSDKDKPLRPGAAGDVAGFLDRVARTPRQAGNAGGRLLFALDATASRQPTWDQASQLQAEMFAVTAGLGGLRIQLCYYHGFGQFHASPWLTDSATLLQQMTAVQCLGGRTQIARLLKHALAESAREKVQALVFIGDAMEESVDELCDLAGQLGMRQLPVFLFLEGQDPTARQAFDQIARLSGGACCPFDAGSAEQLRALLTAVAVYAAGGLPALRRHGQDAGLPARRLVQLLENPRRR